MKMLLMIILLSSCSSGRIADIESKQLSDRGRILKNSRDIHVLIKWINLVEGKVKKCKHRK